MLEKSSLYFTKQTLRVGESGKLITANSEELKLEQTENDGFC